LAAGCGGLSKEDADVRCDQDKQALSALFDDSVYQACEKCFMDCGDSCVRLSTTPLTYTCDPPASTGTGGTGGTKATGGAASK
jgi:hypothetical protein